MRGQQSLDRCEKARTGCGIATKIALWWLRHYDGITHFWRGFSWVWVIGVLMYVVTGSLGLARAMLIIFVAGVIANAGIYCSIRAISAHLKQLQDGPEKQEAHDLMIKIIRARVLTGA